jgi:large subunit ribosomal protein L29
MDKHALKAKALRELSREELQRKLEEFKKNLFELRHKAHFQTLDKSHTIRQVRRAIARTLSLLNETTNKKAGDEKKS